MRIEVASAVRISDIEDRALRPARSASYARHFASAIVLRNWRWGTDYGNSRLEREVIWVELEQRVFAEQVVETGTIATIIILGWDTEEIDEVGIWNFENFGLDQEHRASMVVTFQNKRKELSLGQEDNLDSPLLGNSSKYIKHSLRGIEKELLKKHWWGRFVLRLKDLELVLLADHAI